MGSLETGALKTGQRVGTVVIVDDETMVTTSLQTMLSLETAYRVHCFNRPLDALTQLDALKPDVVISDFSMPGMDGISFLRAVKARLPDSTLILLTGYADKESAIDAINTVGIYRYIEKPWDNQELKIGIRNGLERSWLVGDLRRSVVDLTRARAALEQANHHLETLVDARTRDLQVAYQKLHSILTHTPDGILTLDARLRITTVNPTMEAWLREHLGVPSGAILSTPLEKYLTCSPNGRKGHGTIRALFDQQTPRREGEVFLGEKPFEAGIAPLTSRTTQETGRLQESGIQETETPGTGAEDGFVLVLRDITERKKIESLRDDFVSTLTHDLRTPLLAAIQTLGFFTDGSLGNLAPRQTELLQMLIHSHREMLGLVNVLLDVYRYESGRQNLLWETVHIPELLKNTCRELEALALNREQQLTLHDAIDEKSRVMGDRQELRRVFVNLIGNAIHFTPKGGAIRVSVDVQSDRLQVCVADTGRGIPLKDIPMLFQRFSQGTSLQRSSGSGLGLYLSRQIVEAHGGEIRVESEEGRGSWFYVSLPLA